MSLPRDLLLERARRALESGRPQEAIQLLLEATGAGGDVEVWAELGHAYAEAENYAAAINAFERARHDAPNSPSVLSGMAAVYDALGRWAEAEKLLKLSIELAPTSARFVMLGHAQSAQGNLKDANASFQDAIRLDPNNEEALFNLAILRRSDHPAEAERLLVRAIELAPDFGAARRELGFMYLGRGLLVKSEELLRAALELDSDDAWANVYLGNLLYRKGEYKLASEAYRRAAEKEPFWALPRWLNGDVLNTDPNLGDPLLEYHAAVLADNSDAVAAVRLGAYLVRKGRIDEGRRWIQQARALDPSVSIPDEVALRLRDSAQ
jgi:tetratricopeptide (TPR) repeat protein